VALSRWAGRWTGTRHRYELVDQIGAGAHGTVWSAWDRDRRRTVVAKLAPERAGPETEHRFLQERRLRVEHPNVIGATDDLEYRGRIGFVMELADVGDLAAVVGRNGPLDHDQVLLLGHQLLRGLDHLHRRGIIHRDVKPTNVLFRTLDGVVTAAVGDLGTALDLDGPRLTTFSERIGTVGFMAPEVERGDEASERSDLYSLGRTLEFALTGSSRTAPLAEELPEPLRHVLGLLVASDPALRVRSAAEALTLMPSPAPDIAFPGAPESARSILTTQPGSTPEAEPGSERGAAVVHLARRLAPLVAVAVVSSAVTLALTRSNEAGAPAPQASSTSVAPPPSLTRGSLALGARFTCALGAGGSVACRGAINEKPQGQAASIWAGPLADGPCVLYRQRLLGCANGPEPPGPLMGSSSDSDTEVDSVAVSGTGGCAIAVGSGSARLECWGEVGPLTGDQGTEFLQGQFGVVSLAEDRGCVLDRDRGLQCWEAGSVPVPAPVRSDVTSDVSVGPRGICAIADGRVWCWGDGSSELWPLEPTAITGLTGSALRVAIGADHGCALVDGDVACWGRVTAAGSEPQRGPTPLRALPVVDLGSPGSGQAWVDLAAGERHTCARSASDEVWCWGANESGQVDPRIDAVWLGPTRFGAG
jgi:serine/threonine protein kinase